MLEGAAAYIAHLLDDARVSYALIGGHAVNVWLEPRFTADIDIVMAADPAAFARLRKVLVTAGFGVDAEHGGDLASGPDFVRFGSPDRRIRLEIQAAKTEFQREVIRRAAVQESAVRVATPEDLVVMKLIADRLKDRADLAGLARLPQLDWGYVERWAREWQVFEKARALRGQVES